MASWPLMPSLSCTPFLYGCDRDITLDPLRHFECPFSRQIGALRFLRSALPGALCSYRSALWSPERSYRSALIPSERSTPSGALWYSAMLFVERSLVALCRSVFILSERSAGALCSLWSAPFSNGPLRALSLRPHKKIWAPPNLSYFCHLVTYTMTCR